MYLILILIDSLQKIHAEYLSESSLWASFILEFAIFQNYNATANIWCTPGQDYLPYYLS